MKDLKTRARGGKGYSSPAEKEILARRRNAMKNVTVIAKEGRGEGTGKGRTRMATVGSGHSYGGFRSPAGGVAKAIRDALNPDTRARPVTTLADMSPEKRAEMERLYGKKK